MDKSNSFLKFFLLLCITLFVMTSCSSGGGSSGGGNSNNNKNITALSISANNFVTHLQVPATISVIATYNDGSKEDVTSNTQLQSSNVLVATINQTGTLMPKTAGSTTISANYSGITSKINFNVSNAALNAIDITQDVAIEHVGILVQPAAIGIYSDGQEDLTQVVTWNSTNPSIVSINSIGGLQTPQSAGNTVITANLNSVSGSENITVISNAAISSLAVTPSNLVAHKNIPIQANAIVTFVDGVTQDVTNFVTWDSSVSNVATISASGLILPINAGSTKIRATFKGFIGDTPLTVSTAALNSMNISIIPFVTNLSKNNMPSIKNIIATDITTHYNVPVQAIVTGNYADGTQNITLGISWNSSNSNIIAVVNNIGSNGKIIPVGGGSSVVTATFSNISTNININVSLANITEITITAKYVNVPVGLLQQFTALASYDDNTVADITSSATWTSANTAIVLLSPYGLMNALTVGNSNITCSFQNMLSNTLNITVNNSTLSSISISPLNVTSFIDINTQFTAQGTYSNNNVYDITNMVTWKIDNPTIAQISNLAGNQGLVTPIKAGTTLVRANFSGMSANTNYTVSSAVLSSITISAPSNKAILGGVLQFTASGTYSDGTTKDITNLVTWQSSNLNVATISNAVTTKGLLTTVLVGATNVTAVYDNVTSNVSNIEVIGITGITISPTTSITLLSLGATQQYTALVTLSDGSVIDGTNSVNWSSSNISVAIINTHGLATANGIGSTNISAKIGSISSLTSQLNVQINLVSIAVTPVSKILNGIGSTQQFTATGTFSDSTTKDITNSVTWVSSSPLVASINSSGLVTVQSGGTTNITASSGMINGFTNVTVAVYAFVPNLGSATVSQFVFNPSTGLLSVNSNGATVATGSAPTWVAITPSGQYAYVVNNSGTISQFILNQSTGVLSANPNGASIASSCTNPLQMTIEPTGKYAFVVCNSNVVSQYIIQSNGTLTNNSPATFATGTNPQQIAFDQTGRYAFVANVGNGVNEYSLNTSNGTLTSTGTIAAGTNAVGIVFDPTNRYVYVSNNGATANISQYTFNSGSGLLSANGVSPTLGGSLTYLIVDPSGKYVYVASNGTSTVIQYVINQGTGVLTANTPNNVGVGTTPNGIVFDPSGKFAFAINYGSGTISQLIFSAGTGLLTANSPATISVGTSPFTIVFR